MPAERFWFLYGAMLDVIDPDATDTVEEVATRAMRRVLVERSRR